MRHSFFVIGICAVSIFVAVEGGRAQPAADAPLRTELSEIDWSGLRGALDAETLLRNAPLPRGALRNPRSGFVPALPVLLPRDDRFMPNVRIILLKNSYIASGDIDGTSVSIHGTRSLVILPPDDPVRRAAVGRVRPQLPNGVVYSVYQTSSGVDLTFERFGAAYIISVVCPNTDADARCAQPEFIVGLAQTMALSNDPQ